MPKIARFSGNRILSPFYVEKSYIKSDFPTLFGYFLPAITIFIFPHPLFHKGVTTTPTNIDVFGTKFACIKVDAHRSLKFRATWGGRGHIFNKNFRVSRVRFLIAVVLITVRHGDGATGRRGDMETRR